MYLPIPPTAYKHTASHWGKWERKLCICTTEFGSNRNNHGHDARIPHGFLEALTGDNPPGHPESKTRQPPRIQTFKRSAFDLPTYLPDLTKSHKGKKELQVDEKEFLLFFFFARSKTPTRRHNQVRAASRPPSSPLWAFNSMREQTTPISTD